MIWSKTVRIGDVDVVYIFVSAVFTSVCTFTICTFIARENESNVYSRSVHIYSRYVEAFYAWHMFMIQVWISGRSARVLYRYILRLLRSGGACSIFTALRYVERE